MEKDLRDAYKALKLMRADLTRTKKEKQALEHQFTLYMQTHEAQQQQQHNQNSNGSSIDTDAEMTATRRAEHALMQHEDAQEQLRRLQKEHAALQQEFKALKKKSAAVGIETSVERLSNQHAHEEEDQDERERSKAQVSNAKKDATSAFEYYNNGKAERGNQDRESDFTVETEPIGSHNGEDEPHDNQMQQKQQPKQLPQEETSIVEEMVREKLGLLANLFTLKTKLDEQTSEMLEQQANFVHERDELCMQLEELSEQMVALQSHVMDVENEKQFIEEKYDFLITELDLMKKERAESIGQSVEPETLELDQEEEGGDELEADAELGEPKQQQYDDEDGDENGVDEGRENDRDAVESKLRELEVIREQLEAERSALCLQRKQQQSDEEKSASGAEAPAPVEMGNASKIESLTQLNAILQQQLVEKEEQLATLNVSTTKEQSSLIRDLEEKLRVMKSEKSDLSAAKKMLERDLEALKRNRDANSSQHEQKLEGLSQTNLILQQQLQEKEVELAALKIEMKKQATRSQEQMVAAVQDRDRAAEELRSALKEMEIREAESIQHHGIALQNVQAVHKDLENALEASLQEQQEAHDALLEQFTQQQAANASETEKLNRYVQEKEKSLASLQLELKLLREQTSALEQELSDKSEVIVRLETEKQQMVKQIHELQDQLVQEIEALKHSHETQLKAKQEEFQAQVSENLAFQKAQHDKSLKASAMEVKALLQETRQLKLSLKQKEEEMTVLRSMADATNAELLSTKEEHERVSQQASEGRDLLQYQLSVLETQLMEIEDKKRGEEDEFDDFAVVDDSSKNLRAWGFIKQKVRELDRFLPQLQSFAYFLDTTLCLCEANTSTLEALSIQNSSGNLTQDIVSFLRFVSQLQRGVGATSHVKQGRRLHRQVLELLSNWYECSEKDDVPAPPFGIASRETSLVLHNWTADQSKRAAAKRWLARMETVTGQASSEEEANLAIEGSTLELQQMTMEVKQAFLMLIIPILKRNPAIYVRVFTRKALVSSGTSSSGSGVEASDEDTSWEMKIHVQLADTLLRRRSFLGTSSPQFRPRPPPLKLSNSMPVMAHVEDRLMATTPTSAQKLQIIQERLQYMQQK